MRCLVLYSGMLLWQLSQQILLDLGQLVHVDSSFTIHATLHDICELFLIWKGLPSLANQSLSLFTLCVWVHLLDNWDFFTAVEPIGGEEL